MTDGTFEEGAEGTSWNNWDTYIDNRRQEHTRAPSLLRPSEGAVAEDKLLRLRGAKALEDADQGAGRLRRPRGVCPVPMSPSPEYAPGVQRLSTAYICDLLVLAISFSEIITRFRGNVGISLHFTFYYHW